MGIFEEEDVLRKIPPKKGRDSRVNIHSIFLKTKMKLVSCVLISGRICCFVFLGFQKEAYLDYFMLSASVSLGLYTLQTLIHSLNLTLNYPMIEFDYSIFLSVEGLKSNLQ